MITKEHTDRRATRTTPAGRAASAVEEHQGHRRVVVALFALSS